MSDQNPRSRRRRIAGETPTPPAAATPPPAPPATAPKKTSAPRQKSAPEQKSKPKKPAPQKSAPIAAEPSTPVSTPVSKAPRRTPASKVAAAVAARDTGAPTRTPSPKPVIPPPAPTPGPRPSADDSTRRPSRGLAISIGFLVLGVVIAGLGVAHWQGLFDAAGDVDARTALNAEEISAASDAAETIFSFSYDDLDGHAEDAKALMTPEFAEQYDTIAPALDDLAPQRQVEVTATTRNAAVLPCGDDCSTDKASVLVFLDQDRRLATDDTPTVFGNRIVVELVKTDGDWKVDDIRAL